MRAGGNDVNTDVEAHDTARPKVRILLDVDGVLNAVHRQPGDHWSDWQRAECMGFTIRYSPSVAARIGALTLIEGVELRWLTTWEHHANKWICPLFGWPDFPVIDRHDIEQHQSGLVVATSGWWKFDEARALYESDGVPFVWIDDDLGHSDDGAGDWITSLDGRALGISPHSEKGLTERLLVEIEEFVAARLQEAEANA